MCDKGGRDSTRPPGYCSSSAIGPGVIWPDTSRGATSGARFLTPDLPDGCGRFSVPAPVRNIYGGQLRWERSTELLAEADEVWPLFQQQMREFKGVLRELHDACR